MAKGDLDCSTTHPNGLAMARHDRKLVRQFDAAMHSIYDAARRLKPPYTPSTFRRMLAEHGGLGTADILLATDTPSDGFTELYLRGKENLILAVEYLVLMHPWRQLFTPEQLAKARRRLADVEVSPPPEDAAERFLDAGLPEELSESVRLSEGAVRQIAINEYERNPIARARCIAHYGAKCAVCDYSFGAVYGSIAEGFIHVHHLRPISEIAGEYVVDPILDLRPVCPNCHAVIHLGGKTRSIEDLKQIMEAARRIAIKTGS